MFYGWLAGFAWTLLIALSCTVMLMNYRRTQDPICFVIFFSWIAVLSCSFLHQCERWRHLWLVTGMVWGFRPQNFIALARQGAAPSDVTPRRVA